MAREPIRIPTFIVNIERRIDRKRHILRQFDGRQEFDVTLIRAVENDKGALGIWLTLQDILRQQVNLDYPFVLIVQDDHRFTKSYSAEFLFSCLEEALKLDVEILLGGISWSESTFPVSEKLFWVEKFSGMQFAFIFRNLYHKLMASTFDQYDACDYLLSDISDRTYVIFPFVSVQEEFGYSDVTPRNSLPRVLTESFNETSYNMEVLKNRFEYLHLHQKCRVASIEHIKFPVYFFYNQYSNPADDEYRSHFNEQDNFYVNNVHSGLPLNPDGSIQLTWETVKEIVDSSSKNGVPLVIFQRSDLTIVPAFSQVQFRSAISTANSLGADVLLGAFSGHFSHALPISSSLFWLNCFCGPSETVIFDFVVIFSRMFPIILDSSAVNAMSPDSLLSSLAKEKMLIYPFVGDYPNKLKTETSNPRSFLRATSWLEAKQRLSRISSAYSSLYNQSF